MDTSETAEAAPAKPKLNFGSLRMIGHFTIRYPRQITYALLALIAAAASTLAIPYGLRLIIDEGFVKNGGDPAPYFYLLLGIVVIIGISTAFRFYFVSWLGSKICCAWRRAFLKKIVRGKSPAE
jgi:ATP-binding cassette subfamily B protein